MTDLAIEVKGLKLLNESDIKKQIDPWIGTNMFSIDVEKVKNNLDSSNIIKSVNLEKKFPDSLILEISERKPFIQLKVKDKCLVFDRNFLLLFTANSRLDDLYCVDAEFKEDLFVQETKRKNLKEDLRIIFTFLNYFYSLKSHIPVNTC